MDVATPEPRPRAWPAPYVRAVWPYEVTYASGPGTHAGLPSTDVTFVLPLDEPLTVSWVDEPATRSTSWASVSGLHARPAAIHHAGRQRGIQLAVTPAGARALWGVPAAALAGELLDVRDLDARWAELPDRLAEAQDWQARSALVHEAVTDAVARHDRPSLRADVGRALALLTRGATVAGTAAEVGLSRRRLSTLVREEVGIGPKEFQRMARFARSRSLLADPRGRPSVATVAARAGYADQAHLAREWARLAGTSPSRWSTEEFPNVQASAVAPATS